ncbi:MAG: metal-dependent hydrolase [Gammaproteobacteria bacterium]|nr:metal-dependent hydrolase [Gammaproteobacteria bacterium]MDH4253353.1 metal-dependent hydrolase [Gammaproteobacteria bacterium]MDH5310127.1 metal-dependent hydrolase [Gammaproteobacteria bacterium]
MDPVCHTLLGATLAATGLERRTRYGRATLIVAANLPDIDAVAHFWGYPATYAFRRGLTHGLPALVVLPFLLAALMLWLDRQRPAAPGERPADPGWLVILAAIGVVSHPMLDWLNNYGMRWLMPFADRWFYGDTLFIIDWIAWLVLATALLAARVFRGANLDWYRRPAVLGIVVLLAYIGMNGAITSAAEASALQALADRPPRRLMASPVPLNPFVRDIVLEYDDEYRFAEYRHVGTPGLSIDELVIRIGDPADFARARAVREGRWFLRWARFPFVVTERRDDGLHLRLGDARYVRDIEKPRLRDFGTLDLEPGTADEET